MEATEREHDTPPLGEPAAGLLAPETAPATGQPAAVITPTANGPADLADLLFDDALEIRGSLQHDQQLNGGAASAPSSSSNSRAWTNGAVEAAVTGPNGAHVHGHDADDSDNNDPMETDPTPYLDGSAPASTSASTSSSTSTPGSESDVPIIKRPRRLLRPSSRNGGGPRTKGQTQADALRRDPARLATARKRLAFQVDLELFLKTKEVATIEREIERAQHALATLHQLAANGTYDSAVDAYRSWHANAEAPGSRTTSPGRSTSRPVSPLRASARSSRPVSPSRSARASRANSPVVMVGGTRLSTALSTIESRARARGEVVAPTLEAPTVEERSRSRDSSRARGEREYQDRDFQRDAVLERDVREPRERGRSANHPVLYARRADGVFVKIVCPDCGKCRFPNTLGFINHARMAHDLDLLSLDEAANVCGQPVPDADVPVDHPCRRIVARAIPSLPSSSATVARPRASTPMSDSAASSPAASPMPLASAAPTAVPLMHMDRVAQPKTGGETRFYVKYRLKLGNVSRYLQAHERPKDQPDCSHQWMVYVDTPQWAGPADKFLVRVRFHLHPSFAPNHVIDVTKAPFQLVRYGWGEFPLRVQLFFADAEKNRPIDKTIDLKLDKKRSGEQVLGSEDIFDVDIHRDTDYTNRAAADPAAVIVPARAVTPVPRSRGPSPNAPRPAPVPARPPPPPPRANALPPPSARRARRFARPGSALDALLALVVAELPVVVAAERDAAHLPYRPATSADEWAAWPAHRRRAVEWLRAQAVHAQVCARLAAVPSAAATDHLSTRWVADWCRDARHTPPTAPPPRTPCAAPTTGPICPRCGGAHGGARGECRSPIPIVRCAIPPVTGAPPPPPPAPPEPAVEDLDVWRVPVPLYDAAFARFVASAIRPLRLPTMTWHEHDPHLDDMAERGGALAALAARRRRGTARAFASAGGAGGLFDVPLADPPRPFRRDLARADVVLGLLGEVAKVFVKRLARAAVGVATREGRGRESEGGWIVPAHVYAAVARGEEFDWLRTHVDEDEVGGEGGQVGMAGAGAGAGAGRRWVPGGDGGGGSWRG
ncbi:YEATS domain-containing protein 2 [Allomyces javanicus]|nr:YEATS domain-containing protein 2 [Allomyces javanicus]